MGCGIICDCPTRSGMVGQSRSANCMNVTSHNKITISMHLKVRPLIISCTCPHDVLINFPVRFPFSRLIFQLPIYEDYHDIHSKHDSRHIKSHDPLKILIDISSSLPAAHAMMVIEINVLWSALNFTVKLPVYLNSS